MVTSSSTFKTLLARKKKKKQHRKSTRIKTQMKKQASAKIYLQNMNTQPFTPECEALVKSRNPQRTGAC